MSTNIYQEAIAEAKKLRDIAEQNATNKIVEAIAPRIRRLIEQELGDELIDEEDPDMSDFGSDAETEMGAAPELPSSIAAPEPDLSMGEPDMLSLDPSLSDDVVIDQKLPDLDTDEEQEKEVTVNITVENSRKSNVILQTVRVKSLVRRLRETKNPHKRTKILKQLSGLSNKLVISNNLLEQKLGNQISNILKESNMSGKTRRPNRRLSENAWWMFEGDEVEDLDLDLEDEGEDAVEEGGDEDIDVAAIESAVEDLAGALGMDVAPAEEAIEDEGEAKEGEGDEELDLDLEEWQMYEVDDEADMQDMHMKEGDEDEDEEDEKNNEIHISESALRRELSKMRRTSSRRRRPTSRRRTNRRRMFESEARDAADNFGGGKLDKEPFIEVDEDTLLNALAEELGDAHSVNQNTNSPEGGAEKVADNFGGGKAQSLGESARRRRARRARQQRRPRQQRVTESRQLLVAKKAAAAAKKELKESNLFNAKLLYVNKLMQQHDLNNKQQRAIVEALDNAKTLREAKLLYTSLTDSLRRRAAGKSTTSSKPINENTLLRSGSGSNSTRSGAPAKSGVELDRWAVLAGIRK